jgi:3-oxoacyl-[acyl-carrier protein] reductase
MKFTGKNVLVTGAASGIGRQIAITLAAKGLKVWINYRSRPSEADVLKQEIESSGGVAAVIGFNVVDEKAFIDGVKTIVDSDGELSYLVNNAGITRDKLAIRMSVEDFNDVIHTNLTSAFIGCREAMKAMMKKRFGSVVNVASIVGETGNAGQVNYSSSKGGLIALTKSFAQEGSARGLRFNAVTPGFIETEMTDKLSEEVKKSYTDSIPLKRFGKPEDIAESVAFLLSDNASYITGIALKINGGLYM